MHFKMEKRLQLVCLVILLFQLFIMQRQIAELQQSNLQLQANLENCTLTHRFQYKEIRSLRPRFENFNSRITELSGKEKNVSHLLREADKKIRQLERFKNASLAEQEKSRSDAQSPSSQGFPRSILQRIQMDHEKLEHFLSMKNIPPDVRAYYTYSKTEYAKLKALNGNHALIIEHIKKYKLIPPSVKFLRQTEAAQDPSQGILPHLLHIFQNKRDGFFIESVSRETPLHSRTIYLERHLNWTGALLIAEPENFEVAVHNRKVHLVPGCLSVTTKPILLNLTLGQHGYSRFGHNDAGSVDVLPVQCFPLISILLALNRTSVDLLSLDTQGDEVNVLKAVPFDKVDIKAIALQLTMEGTKTLIAFMESNGYTMFPSPEEKTYQKEAIVFVKKVATVKSQVLEDKLP